MNSMMWNRMVLMVVVWVMPYVGLAEEEKTSFADLQRQAEQGDADAQFSLALRYAKGYGVPQDYTKAWEWYLKAAAQGDATAQKNLARLGSRGQ